MTLQERRERKFQKLKEKMERENELRREYTETGNTFMLGLLDIKEQELDPDATFRKQLELIFANYGAEMMRRNGKCPCCGKPA